MENGVVGQIISDKNKKMSEERSKKNIGSKHLITGSLIRR
jgi:hypothetical protein